MSGIMTIQGVECYEVDGTAYLKLEAVARGLGFTQTQTKNGTEYTSIRWERVEQYLSEFGFPQKWGKDDFIPENIFYRLAMKAKNCAAEEFQAKIADEIIPAIRKTGGYMTPAAEQKMEQLLEAKLSQLLESKLQCLQDLSARVAALEDIVTTPCSRFPPVAPALPALPAPLPEEAPQNNQPPGRDFLKRWMRTASEKLDLMSSRFNMKNNAILHQLYGFLEDEFDVVLADERLRIMEEYGLEECSTLKAIFYDEHFRDFLQRTIDYNLAPENRGW